MTRFKAFCMSRGVKIFLLFVLILLFLIPKGMIWNLIYERSRRAAEVEREIMRAWGEDFTVLGPLLCIPCLERNEIKTVLENKEEKTEIRETEFFLYLTPEELYENANLETLVKTRGIFSVPLYFGSIQLKGNFSYEQMLGELRENQKAFPEKAELIISIANMNGIKGVKNSEWNGQILRFQPGTNGFSISPGNSRKSSPGIHSAAPLVPDTENSFDIVFTIQGGKSFSMIPIGQSSSFTVQSDWPSPSFQGAYLPVTHYIDENGFKANWEFSYLSQNIPLAWQDRNDSTGFSYSDFEVNFFEAVDHYAMNTRAAKYAILFIIIPFLGFLLFELLMRKNIHPAQYLLAGTGNIIFYLLLLSLSEHIAFAGAYCISALAVVLMTSLYSRSFLGDWGKSWIMGAVMAFLYAFLYFTLQSEDWALLIGSVGAFGITAVVMFLTRKLDWWGTSYEKKADAES